MTGPGDRREVMGGTSWLQCRRLAKPRVEAQGVTVSCFSPFGFDARVRRWVAGAVLAVLGGRRPEVPRVASSLRQP